MIGTGAPRGSAGLFVCGAGHRITLTAIFRDTVSKKYGQVLDTGTVRAYTGHMAATIPATERQLAFIITLSNERTVSELKRASLALQVKEGMSKSDASDMITWLLGLPKSPKPVLAPEDSPYRKVDAILADLPRSRFAIPADALEDWLTETNLRGNDIVFASVKKYGNRIRLYHLRGGYGGYGATRFSIADSLAVATYLSDPQRALEAAQTFGRMHNECGKCGAKLTDPVSRRLFIGPTCRKSFPTLAV